LLLCAVVCFTNAVRYTEPDWFEFSRVVPANQRYGNRYFFDVDNIGENVTFKAVAIHHQGNDVVFGEFKEESSCATFATGDSTVTKCDNTFFLLHANFIFHQRVPLNEALREKKCRRVKFGANNLMVFKYDVLNPSSPKYVGTYVEGNANEGKDLAMYIDDENEKHVIKGILREIVLNQMDPSKIELFCFGEYT
uniref:Salivary lipocalin n=1 Tax=Haemonchus contortus TaxID=6289 RepID=A0A7I4XUJ7_HAECO